MRCATTIAFESGRTEIDNEGALSRLDTGHGIRVATRGVANRVDFKALSTN